MDALRRLLSPEYWAVSRPGALGALWPVYLLLAVAFTACAAFAALYLYASRAGRGTRQAAARPTRALAWFELWVCVAGLIVTAGRFAHLPGLSARIWPVSLAALAVLGLGILRLGRITMPAWLMDVLHILGLDALDGIETQDAIRCPRRVRLAWFAGGLALHLAGTALVIGARYRLPLWLAPLLLLALLAAQFPVARHGRLPRLAALAPLLGAYAAVLLTAAYEHLGITVVGWQGQDVPNPFLSLFYVDGLVLGAVTWAVLCTVFLVTRQRPARRRAQRLALVLLTLTLLWCGSVYFGKRTHGATATDPYAYAQMAVDLAERGTLLHRFELFQQVMPLGIAWAPLQPVGYHEPRNEMGDCPSVWAAGASVLLAGSYKLLGEAGLYTGTPVLALLALAATWALVQESLRREPRPIRSIGAALAVALTATSPEHVDRLLVPMADAPAQLFTTLALLLALRGSRQLDSAPQRAVGWLAATGVAFGWAYWVRHTQLALAVPILLALALAGSGNRKGRRWKVAAVLCFAGAALIAASPDIAYRWQVFGGPLATETTELPAMGLQHAGVAAGEIIRASLVAGEWGYLAPLALYGAYCLARKHKREAAVLGTALLAVLLVHLTYRFVRLRDLLSVFPLVNLTVAWGAVSIVRRLRPALPSEDHSQHILPSMIEGRAPAVRSLSPAPLVAAGAIGWTIFSLAMSRWAMIDDVWKPGWASFGYMRPDQRAAFDRLAELTPQEAVIGASLNAGAVALYSGRDPIRPYDIWTDAEWDTFLSAMRSRGRPVYLLDDGAAMHRFVENQRARYNLRPVAPLAVPIFSDGDRQSGWLYRIEWEP